MTQHEGAPFDQAAHNRRVAEGCKRLARWAIFDEMIDYHLDGDCSFQEAIDQFLHDIKRDGAGYPETA